MGLVGAAVLAGACQNSPSGAGPSTAPEPSATISVSVSAAPAGSMSAAPSSNKAHLGSFVWTREQWKQRCEGVHTSYNPKDELSDDKLTLVPGDPRWIDFVYWALNNKLAEHQVEAYGGTNWAGPQGGVIFHWAPGSHWERDTLASFGFTLGHTIGEHRWLDTMFPDFFDKYGGVYGVNVKDRIAEIDAGSPKVWVEFLEYIGGAKSPYYRYLFHQEALVDAAARKIHLIGGHGVAFTYSFERYYHEVREVLTDCRTVDFFEMYDRLGPGFASSGNWARQGPPAEALAKVGYLGQGEPKDATADATRYDPSPPPVDVPADLPEAEAMREGQKVYLAQCAMCHGIRGDGKGFLARGFDVKPRDFQRGLYRFRSTAAGELPTIEDIEQRVRIGVNNSTMPAWGEFLTPEQIKAVARYLVVFSPRFIKAWKAGKKPAVLPEGKPPADLGALVSRGAGVWKKLECAKCHGKQGQGDGPSASTLKDDWGDPIRATDLSYKWSFKNGYEPAAIYRTFVGGLDGTPMPSYGGSLPDEADRWALVAYVLSLSPEVRPVLRASEFAAERGTRIDRHGHVKPAKGKP